MRLRNRTSSTRLFKIKSRKSNTNKERKLNVSQLPRRRFLRVSAAKSRKKRKNDSNERLNSLKMLRDRRLWPLK